MFTYKIRVRITGQTVIAYFIEAASVGEATTKISEELGYENFKSIAGVSIVKN